MLKFIVKRSLILIAFLILYAGNSLAIVINVPDDEETIQAGIDMADDGDTVLVAAGEYNENIYFDGKEIVVMGVPDNPSETIIDGGEDGSVVIFDNDEGEFSVLTGFTLQNGSGSDDPDGDNAGGGVFIIDASPTLSNLHIINNQADYGAGIYINASSPIISEVYIYANRSEQRGGGIYCSHESSPSISFTTIGNNIAVRSYGAGLYSYDNCRFSMINCTIANNESVVRGSVGGIMISDRNYLELINCIIWDNGDLPINTGNGDFDTLLVRYCDVQGGRGDMRNGGQGDHIFWNGNRNFASNPFFSDPDNGDFRLTEDSPCIDSGDPDSPEDPDETRADIGAFFFNQNEQPPLFEPTPPRLRSPEDEGQFSRVNQLFVWNDTIPLRVEMPVVSYEFWIQSEQDSFTVEPDSFRTELVEGDTLFEIGCYIDSLWLLVNEEQSVTWWVVAMWESDTAETIVLYAENRFRFSYLPLSIVDKIEPQISFGISAIYPNPFNSTVKIIYTVPQMSRVSVKLYDMSGTLVKDITGSNFESGQQIKIWDASTMPSGMYIAALQSSNQIQTKNILLIK